MNKSTVALFFGFRCPRQSEPDHLWWIELRTPYLRSYDSQPWWSSSRDEGREVEAPARGSTCTGGRPIDLGVSAVEEQSAVGAATSEQQPEWWNPDVGQHIQESSRWRSSAKDSRPGADSSRCPELCFGLVLEPPELSSSFSHDPTFWALIPMRLVPMLIVNDCTAIIISSFQLWFDWKAHAIDTQRKVKVNSKLRKR